MNLFAQVHVYRDNFAIFQFCLQFDSEETFNFEKNKKCWLATKMMCPQKVTTSKIKSVERSELVTDIRYPIQKKKNH